MNANEAGDMQTLLSWVLGRHPRDARTSDHAREAAARLAKDAYRAQHGSGFDPATVRSEWPPFDADDEEGRLRAELDVTKRDLGVWRSNAALFERNEAQARGEIGALIETIVAADADRDRLAAQVQRATDVDLIRHAIADPGAFVQRENRDSDDRETVPAWGARAVLTAITGEVPAP